MYDFHDACTYIACELPDGFQRILVEFTLVHNSNAKPLRKLANPLVALYIKAEGIARELLNIATPTDIAVAKNFVLIRHNIIL